MKLSLADLQPEQLAERLAAMTDAKLNGLIHTYEYRQRGNRHNQRPATVQKRAALLRALQAEQRKRRKVNKKQRTAQQAAAAAERQRLRQLKDNDQIVADWLAHGADHKSNRAHELVGRRNPNSHRYEGGMRAGELYVWIDEHGCFTRITPRVLDAMAKTPSGCVRRLANSSDFELFDGEVWKTLGERELAEARRLSTLHAPIAPDCREQAQAQTTQDKYRFQSNALGRVVTFDHDPTDLELDLADSYGVFIGSEEYESRARYRERIDSDEVKERRKRLAQEMRRTRLQKIEPEQQESQPDLRRPEPIQGHPRPQSFIEEHKQWMRDHGLSQSTDELMADTRKLFDELARR